MHEAAFYQKFDCSLKCWPSIKIVECRPPTLFSLDGAEFDILNSNRQSLSEQILLKCCL